MDFTNIFLDSGEGRERERDTRVETPDDGQKGGGKGAQGHGRRVDPPGGGKAFTSPASVETTIDAK